MIIITKLLEGGEDDVNSSQKHIHLWEDILPTIKEKSMRTIELPKEVILYKFSIKHALTVMGFEDRILYPLMRINGYKSYGEEVKGSSIIVPESFSLDEAITALLKD